MPRANRCRRSDTASWCRPKEWVLANLAGRPTLQLGERYSTLGRETSLQKVVFDPDGWLRLAHGGHHAAVDVPVDLPESAPVQPAGGFAKDFAADALDTRRWSTLRAPLGDAGDLTSRPGWLRLRCGHSPASVFEQSMILTRVEEHRAAAEVVVEAGPRSFREIAGLIAWYDRNGWIWLQITWDEENGRHARVVCRDGRATTHSAPVAVPDGPLRLHARLDAPDLRFAVGSAHGDASAVPGSYPAWTLSDDHGPRLRFTGLFFGVHADDLDVRRWFADFAEFRIGFARAWPAWPACGTRRISPIALRDRSR